VDTIVISLTKRVGGGEERKEKKKYVNVVGNRHEGTSEVGEKEGQFGAD